MSRLHRIRLVAGQRPVVGEWDPLGLDGVANNLVSNAIKCSRMATNSG